MPDTQEADEETAYRALSQRALKKVWDNPKDEEASKFYLRRSETSL